MAPINASAATPNVTSCGLIADRRYGFGRDLAARGDLAAAADLFAQAAEAAPGFAAAWFALGEMRVKLGDDAAAVAAFERAVAADPQDRCGAGLRLANLGAAEAANAMSRTYVQTLFDQYAPRFDAALQALEYRGPERLRAAVERARPGAVFGWSLDLGCGTGLAGAAFRASAGHLTGVDLSSAMVAQARGKNIYDRLETGDLLDFLAAEYRAGGSYDLVIAADVFVYVFDLEPSAVAAARVLRPDGVFAFTVETHPGDGIELGAKLRYRHGTAHLRTALTAAGLRLLELSPVATRTEAGDDVPGLLALAEWPAGRR